MEKSNNNIRISIYRYSCSWTLTFIHHLWLSPVSLSCGSTGCSTWIKPTWREKTFWGNLGSQRITSHSSKRRIFWMPRFCVKFPFSVFGRHFQIPDWGHPWAKCKQPSHPRIWPKGTMDHWSFLCWEYEGAGGQHIGNSANCDGLYTSNTLFGVQRKTTTTLFSWVLIMVVNRNFSLTVACNHGHIFLSNNHANKTYIKEALIFLWLSKVLDQCEYVP